MQCPKCRGQMQTYNRNGVQIEQCANCRGIFLDYGELEALTRLESQWTQPGPPPPPAAPQYPAAPVAPAAPAWGAPQHGGHGGHYGHGHRQKGFGRMLFSS
ncbi:zf-TFIIB domain-containing protein [Streptomyces sp. NPDC004610]|uniref:TFIIB-type zinc ribbon-containing protein n=1 Tax=unclassified Streptomyces TaxID=2593676 RepID=UPI00339F1C77